MCSKAAKRPRACVRHSAAPLFRTALSGRDVQRAADRWMMPGAVMMTTAILGTIGFPMFLEAAWLPSAFAAAVGCASLARLAAAIFFLALAANGGESAAS
jgi:hypothetical protein